MSLSSRYRHVLVASLHIRNEEKVPAHVPTYSFERIKEIIAKKHSKRQTNYSFEKGTRLIHVRDIQESINGEQQFLCLLLSLGNKDAPDAVYSDFENGATRKFPKRESEGNANTSHILLC